MKIDFNSTDIAFAILGGALISLATSLNLLLKGRITGFSGIFFGLITFDKGFQWKLSLFAGVISASSLFFDIFKFNQIVSGNNNVYAFDTPEVTITNLSLIGFAIAGLLVGFGTKLSNGCTSGHGVCGLPRLSIRSWVAVPIFMTGGMVFATLRSKVPFFTNTDQSALQFIQKVNYNVFANVIFVIGITIFLACYINAKFFKKEPELEQDILISYAIGVIFASGLVLSGMSRRTKILGFLTFENGWDPSLLFVMLSAVGMNFGTFYYIINVQKKPLFGEKLEIPTNTTIDWRLCLGAFLFGIGWGIGGLCPGPVLTLLPLFNTQVWGAFIIFLAGGQKLAEVVDNWVKNEQPAKKEEISNLINQQEVQK